jgi:hypothetical protein
MVVLPANSEAVKTKLRRLILSGTKNYAVFVLY